MSRPDASYHRRIMFEEDFDATPRVLRVVNPNMSEGTGSISSRVASQKSKSFSFKSFSGSFSSLWRRHVSTSTRSSDSSCMPITIPLRRTSPSSPGPSSRLYRRIPDCQQPAMAPRSEGSQRPNPLQPPPVGLPAVASLRVSTSSFVVGEDVGRRPCAYVIFDMTCGPQNALHMQLRASRRGPLAGQLDNDPGHLDGLQVAISVDGPAVKLFEIGPRECQTLRVDDRWIVVVKIELKENLAARLSGSVRSKTDNSSSLIDQFLQKLEVDSKRSQSVFVRAVIRYRHAFFSEDTMLETAVVCAVGSLTTTSPIASLQNSTLQTSIIHALDPGLCGCLHLNSVSRPERQLHIEFPFKEAQALISDFRHVFGSAIHRLVDTDLVNLEAYYYYKSEPRARPSTSTLKKYTRRARTVMTKLSLKKKDVG